MAAGFGPNRADAYGVKNIDVDGAPDCSRYKNPPPANAPISQGPATGGGNTGSTSTGSGSGGGTTSSSSSAAWTGFLGAPTSAR